MPPTRQFKIAAFISIFSPLEKINRCVLLLAVISCYNRKWRSIFHLIVIVIVNLCPCCAEYIALEIVVGKEQNVLPFPPISRCF